MTVYRRRHPQQAGDGLCGDRERIGRSGLLDLDVVESGDENLRPYRLTADVERRIGGASNPDPGVDQGLADGRSRAEDTRLEHSIGGRDVQGKPSVVLDSRRVDDAHGLDVSIRVRF